jgi:Coenzyme PQQ synthesis protein D (PqqD)
MTTPTVSLRHNALAWQVIDSELVLLDLRTATYFSVNASGTVLWELLARGTTRAKLAEELVGRYGLDDRRASSDVDRFLEALESRSLLQQPAISPAP